MAAAGCTSTATLEVPADADLVVSLIVRDGSIRDLALGRPPMAGPTTEPGDVVVTTAFPKGAIVWEGESEGLRAVTDPTGFGCGRCLFPAVSAPLVLTPGSVCRVPVQMGVTSVDGQPASEEEKALVSKAYLVASGDCKSQRVSPKARSESYPVRSIWPPGAEDLGLRAYSPNGSILELTSRDLRYVDLAGGVETYPFEARPDLAFGLDDGTFTVISSVDDTGGGNWRAHHFIPGSPPRTAVAGPQFRLTAGKFDRQTGRDVLVVGTASGSRPIGYRCTPHPEEAFTCVPLPTSDFGTSLRLLDVETLEDWIIYEGNMDSLQGANPEFIALGRGEEPFSVSLLPPDVLLDPEPSFIGTFMAGRWFVVQFWKNPVGPSWFVGLELTPELLADPNREDEVSRQVKVLASYENSAPCLHATFEPGGTRLSCEDGTSMLIDVQGRATRGPHLGGEQIQVPWLREVRVGAHRFAETFGGSVYRSTSDGPFQHVLGPRSHARSSLVPAPNGRGHWAFGEGGLVLEVDGTRGTVTSSRTVAGLPAHPLVAVRTGNTFLVGGLNGNQHSLVNWEEGRPPKNLDWSSLGSVGVPVMGSAAGEDAFLLTDREDLIHVRGEALTHLPIPWAIPPEGGSWPFPCRIRSGRGDSYLRQKSPLRAVDAIQVEGTTVAFAVACGDQLIRATSTANGFVVHAFALPLMKAGGNRPDDAPIAIVRAITPDLVVVGTEGSGEDEARGVFYEVSLRDSPGGFESEVRFVEESSWNHDPNPKTGRSVNRAVYMGGPLDGLLMANGEHWSTFRTVGAAEYFMDPRTVEMGSYDPGSSTFLLGMSSGGLIFAGH